MDRWCLFTEESAKPRKDDVNLTASRPKKPACTRNPYNYSSNNYTRRSINCGESCIRQLGLSLSLSLSLTVSPFLSIYIIISHSCVVYKMYSSFFFHFQMITACNPLFTLLICCLLPETLNCSFSSYICYMQKISRLSCFVASSSALSI